MENQTLHLAACTALLLLSPGCGGPDDGPIGELDVSESCENGYKCLSFGEKADATLVVGDERIQLDMPSPTDWMPYPYGDSHDLHLSLAGDGRTVEVGLILDGPLGAVGELRPTWFWATIKTTRSPSPTVVTLDATSAQIQGNVVVTDYGYDQQTFCETGLQEWVRGTFELALQSESETYLLQNGSFELTVTTSYCPPYEGPVGDRGHKTCLGLPEFGLRI